MRKTILFFLLCLISNCGLSQVASSNKYLELLIKELELKWPANRTINVVFHGHSVPTGYFSGSNVNTLDAYPHQTLVNLKKSYHSAVINCITTSIGGEHSEQGLSRFIDEVLCMHPDVIFIDYALNDRSIGLKRAEVAWSKMIELSLKYNSKVILMTPTPDITEDILSTTSPLAIYADMIRDLAVKYKVGLIDSYKMFQEMKASGVDLKDYMSQSNHINEKGHKIVSDEINKWFKSLVSH